MMKFGQLRLQHPERESEAEEGGEGDDTGATMTPTPSHCGIQELFSKLPTYTLKQPDCQNEKVSSLVEGILDAKTCLPMSHFQW